MIVLVAASGALFFLVPAVEDVLPEALAAGFSHVHLTFSALWIVPALALAAAAAHLDFHGNRRGALAAIALAVVLSVVRLIAQVYPVLDRVDSARGVANGSSITCVPPSARSRHYGLNYYAGRELPDCN